MIYGMDKFSRLYDTFAILLASLEDDPSIANLKCGLLMAMEQYEDDSGDDSNDDMTDSNYGNDNEDGNNSNANNDDTDGDDDN